MSLRPCASCGRHVRASERACPFCAATLAPTSASAQPAVGRLGRAAIFAFGAAASTVAVASIEGCGSTTEPADAAAMVDSGGPAPAYGAPPDDAGADAASPDIDSGGPAPAYGAPPDDAGTDAGMLAMYGGPPLDDAGTANDAAIDAAGSVAPAYGTPSA